MVHMEFKDAIARTGVAGATGAGGAVEATEAGDTATGNAFVRAVYMAPAGNTGTNGIAAASYAADADGLALDGRCRLWRLGFKS